MSLQNITHENSNSVEIFQSHTEIKLPVMLAIGITAVLAGFFICLAAHQILPHGINAVSNLGIGGYCIGYGVLGAGFILLIICTVKWALPNSEAAAFHSNEDTVPSDSKEIQPLIDQVDHDQKRQYWRQEIEKIVDTDLVFLKEKLGALTSAQRMAVIFWIMNLRDGIYVTYPSIMTTSGKKIGYNKSNTTSEYPNFLHFLRRHFEAGHPCKYTDSFYVDKISKLITSLVNKEPVLDIEVSDEQMLDAFIKFDRLILLRPLSSKKLLLGCGMNTCRMDDPGKTPVHKDMDTVDIYLGQNPSVCCNWSNPKQCAFFSNRYETIEDEGPVISYMKDPKVFYRNCRKSLDVSAPFPRRGRY